MFKPFGIMMYVGFGGFCLYVTSVRQRLAATMDTSVDRILAAVPIGLAFILLLWFAVAGSHLLLAAVVIGISFFAVQHAAWKAPGKLIAAAAAVILVLSLAWWRIAPSPLEPLPLAGFGAILGGLMIGLSDRWKRRQHMPIIPVSAFLLAGFLLLIDLGGYRPDEPILFYLAHHWGAYIGSALQLRAGLVPFNDIPLQYGLGPALTIAAVCGGSDCWMGTECVVIAANLACGLLVLCMVLATAVRRGQLWLYAATIVVFAAVFLWPGGPADGSGVLATPSVGGMRFLPVTLVASLLFFGRPAAAATALIPAVLWSPESAAMSITVFGLCEADRVGFAAALLRCLFLLVVSYAGLVLLHRATFGIWMDPLAFVEYVLHVPGPLPINPISDAMLLAAVLGFGGWLIIRRAPDPLAARRDRTATFLLFAVTSYWLGRSHPNNICNLMPFLVLVSFRVIDRPTGVRSLLADVTGFGTAVSVAALSLSPWHSVPYEFPATVDIHGVVANFPSLEPDIDRIRRQIVNPDGLGVADFGPSYTRYPSETIIWTPMDPSSLWSYVPSERRQLYIQRSAARIRRAGWAIIEDDQSFLYDDLHAGYVVAERQEFYGAPSALDGSRRHFVAACFNPRPDIATSIVGPACPAPPGLVQ